MGIIESILALVFAIGAAVLFGKRWQKNETAARGAKDYRNERQKIDTEISGIGSTDSDRISRLRDIERKRSGKD